MSNTTNFVDKQTVITAGWANDINNAVFSGNAPQGLSGGISKIVPNIASLRTLVQSEASTVTVSGYYVGGDGGGGLYSLVATSPGSYVDNGGSIIIATDGGVWKLQATEFVSIKQFGAYGNGTSNDGTAFTNMVNYCSTTGINGFIPAGNYLLPPSNITFTGNLPFTLYGEGRGQTTLTNSNASSSFIYWEGADGVGFRDLTINGGFTGLPSIPTTGGTLVLQNSNNNSLLRVDFNNIYRVACLIYNDHQTTLTHVYGGHRIDSCRVFGPSNWSANVGPSAFLLADVNNSWITNCYINNIGLYGYEFKNDSSNNYILGCTAEDTYYPLYFGGDGAHTELGYVKNSVIADCVVKRAQSACGVFLGYASQNIVRNVSIDQTNCSTSNYAVYVQNNSNNNSITGINLKARQYYAVAISTACSDNVIEFSNIVDGSYSGRGINGISSDCSNNTVIFGNRDSTQQMILETTAINSNSIVDKKYLWETSTTSATGLKKTRLGDNGTDAIPGSSKGIAWTGVQCDQFVVTQQAYHWSYVGTTSKYNNFSWRYDFVNGEKREYLFDTGTSTTATYVWSRQGYYPAEDNSRILGGSSSRWSVVYAATGTINTSDEREKQDIRTLNDAEIAVAKDLKAIVKAYRWKSAVSEKGQSARIHFGWIAQEVISTFEKYGLNAFDYGCCCYDKWDEVLEEKDEAGNIIQQAKEAGDRYGVRLDEITAFIISTL